MKFAILILFALCTPVFAAPPPQTYEQCKSTAGLNDGQLKECDAREVKRVEDELAKIVQETLQLVDSNSRKDLLRRAQKSWLAFREAECEFRGTAVGKTPIAPLLKSKCVIDQTSMRVDQLKSTVKTETF